MSCRFGCCMLHVAVYRCYLSINLFVFSPLRSPRSRRTFLELSLGRPFCSRVMLHFCHCAIDHLSKKLHFVWLLAFLHFIALCKVYINDGIQGMIRLWGTETANLEARKLQLFRLARDFLVNECALGYAHNKYQHALTSITLVDVA